MQLTRRATVVMSEHAREQSFVLAWGFLNSPVGDM